MLRSSAGVAVSTLVCRILGLVRVMCEARVLGGGALASAWSLAFTLPNQLRTILGEGALGAALVPLLTHAEVEAGRDEVRKRLAVIFAALGVLLSILVVAISAGALVLAEFTDGYWRQAMRLIPLMMPYGLFMCLVGIAASVLNMRRVFFLPSLGNLLLNLTMISALALIAWGAGGDYEFTADQADRILFYLGITVLLSGVLHLGLMAWLMARYGVWPEARRPVDGARRVLRELFSLALPGIVGASALQISFVIGQLLAALLSEHALPALKYTERLVYLPIGVLALSLSMVLFSSMSHAAAEKNYREMCANVAWGMRLVQFVCVPLAAFIILFREPLLRLLYLGGAFDQASLDATSQAMLFYAFGIPSFCAIKVVLPAFYSRKDTKTPLKCSLIAIGSNLAMTLALMIPLQQGGIALATVLSSTLNNTLLLHYLKRQGHPIPLGGVAATAARALAATAVPLALLWWGYAWLEKLPRLAWMPRDLLPLGVAGAVFVAAYLVLSRLFGCREGSELLGSFRRK